MSETKDDVSIEKYLSDKLDTLSKTLPDEVPHLFCIFDREKEQFAYWGNIDDREAGQIIELLAKQHGGKMFDDILDRLIEASERLEFSETIETPE